MVSDPSLALDALTKGAIVATVMVLLFAVTIWRV